MHKFAIAAAAVTFGALLASAPAQALNGQVKKDGKCFVPAQSHNRDLGFGFWGECPQQASSTVASTPANTHSRPIRHRSTS
jgi:hypothetical protein